MTITGKQIAMARILLELSQKELADALKIARKTIMRIENGQSPGSSSTLEKIQNYFERKNIAFSGEHGVDKKTGDVITLKGAEGLKELINDIYNTARDLQSAGKATKHFLVLYNARPKNWIKWLTAEWWNMHSNRMAKIGPDLQRIMHAEGETQLISERFSEHKYFSSHLFFDQSVSVYAYGKKVAFVTFGEDFLTINVLENEQFARGFRALFDITWDHVARPAKTPSKSKGKRA